MLTLKKVALTGSLSSGKSTVLHYFEQLGAKIVSADNIVHQLLSPNTVSGNKVEQLLGKSIIINGQFDRKAIAKKVFSTPSLLQALEDILHPEVQKEISRIYKACKEKNSHSLFVAEVPLLFESQSDKSYDFTIAVCADPKICLARYESKGGDRTDFFQRQKRQLSSEVKGTQADFIIDNNTPLEALKSQVESVYHKLIQKPIC